MLDDKLQPFRIAAAHRHFLLNWLIYYKRQKKSLKNTNKNKNQGSKAFVYCQPETQPKAMVRLVNNELTL